MSEYYTPQQIAHFIAEGNLDIQTTNQIIQEIFQKEYPFIHPKYQNNQQQFQKETETYTNFITFKKEFENELKKEKTNDYINQYKEFLKIQPNFFITTRLTLLYIKKHRIIKLRTLLKLYGYKTRKSNIILKFHDNIIFYHLKTYHKDEQKDISQFELDEWITFKLQQNE